MLPATGEAGERLFKALASLRGNPDWDIVERWIRDSLGQVFLEQGLYSPEPSKYVFNAGRNCELRELVSTIDKARKR